MELIESLQGFVAENLSLLTPVDQAWQPTDFLPDLTAEDWAEQVTRFRTSARQVSDDLLVVLVGNMVTEEALPSYAVSLEPHRPRPDRDRRRPLGPVAAGVDGRGEPARRPAQRLPPAHGPGGHAGRRADDPSPHQERIRLAEHGGDD